MRLTFLIVLCFWGCNNSAEEQKEQLPSKTLESNFAHTYLDTLCLKDQLIVLTLPFQLDTSYYQAQYCGNSPRCKCYEDHNKQIKVTLCQQMYVQDVYAEENPQNKGEHYLKQIMQDRYGKRVEYWNFPKQILSSKTSGSWFMNGVRIKTDSAEVLHLDYHNFGNPQVDTATRFATTEYNLHTYISLEADQSSASTEEMVRRGKYICQKIQL